MPWSIKKLKDLLPNRPFGKTAKDNRVARLVDLDYVVSSANEVFSEIEASTLQSIEDNGTGVVSINQLDPQNPVVNFNGVYVDNVTITGNGTVASPLEANIPPSSSQGVHVLVKPSTGDKVNNSLVGTNTFTISNSVLGGRLRIAPFIPATTITSSALEVYVSTQGVIGSTANLLIYSDLNGKPGSLIYSSTSLDCTSTGFKTALTSQTFTAGTTYWIGVQVNSTVGFYVLDIGRLLGIKYNLSEGIATTIQVIPGTVAPNPFPTLALSNYTVANMPMINIIVA